MIDVDSMQDYIRTANPVPNSDQLDPEELARFVAMAEAAPRTSSVLEAEPAGQQATGRRGPAVAIATAAVALSAVALTVVLAGTFGGGDAVRDEPSPAATGQPDVTSAFRNPALFTKRLVPHPTENPPPLSTAIGDLEFEMLEFESPSYNLYEASWTPHGLVAATNDRLYWSTDYYTWQSIDTSVPADAVTVVDEDVVVRGNGGTVRYEWGGAGWIEVGALDVMGVERITYGTSGAVAVVGDTLWYSTDGVHFEQAEQAPSLGPAGAAVQGSCPTQFGPLDSGQQVLATESGYVTLTSSWPGYLGRHPTCTPVLWFSPDGNKWELVSEESPFGELSNVYEVVERDGRFVAVGTASGSSAVIWVSDDGLAWERIDLDLQNIDGIAAGGLGWVITGSNLGSGDEEWVQVMLFSADGRTWDGPYLRPETLNTGYLPPQMAVGDDVIFGIGGSRYDVLLARLRN